MPRPSIPAAPRLPASFRDLEHSNFAAQAAEKISLAAVPIVAVVLLGAGPGEIGLLAALQSLPFLLLSGLGEEFQARRDGGNS